MHGSIVGIGFKLGMKVLASIFAPTNFANNILIFCELNLASS